MERIETEKGITLEEAAPDEAAEHLEVQKRAFMLEAESRCGDAERLELFVGSRSHKTIHIYEKMGYRTYKSKEVRDDIKLLYMEKPGRA